MGGGLESRCVGRVYQGIVFQFVTCVRDFLMSKSSKLPLGSSGVAKFLMPKASNHIGHP